MVSCVIMPAGKTPHEGTKDMANTAGISALRRVALFPFTDDGTLCNIISYFALTPWHNAVICLTCCLGLMALRMAHSALTFVVRKWKSAMAEL